MSPAQSLLAYTLAASVLTVTPGVDTALVLRLATLEGPRPALHAALGVVIGCLAWGAAVAAGLGGLVAASDAAFTALKWIGAAYLMWLGIGMIRKPRQALLLQGIDATAGAAAARPVMWLRRGFMTNVLNPKVGIFYVSLFPQFMPTGVAVGPYSFLLAGIHALLGLVWFASLVAASIPIARALRHPRAVAIMDRVTGCVFVAFGAKLALSQR